MALHVVNEARRCLNCKVPQCRKGCPINTPIPDMIQLFLQNQLEYTYPALKITFPTLILIACPPFCRLLPESGLLSSEAVLPESPSLCFWLKKDMM